MIHVVFYDGVVQILSSITKVGANYYNDNLINWTISMGVLQGKHAYVGCETFHIDIYFVGFVAVHSANPMRVK